MESERLLFCDRNTTYTYHHPDSDDHRHTHDHADANDHNLPFGNFVTHRDESTLPKRGSHQHANLHTSPNQYKCGCRGSCRSIFDANPFLDKHNCTDGDEHIHTHPNAYSCADHPADTHTLLDDLSVIFDSNLSSYTRIVF